MSIEYDFDLFVIGAGSGGVRAGRMAAAKGKKVAIAEVSDLGGTCVNVGCVPKKLFVYASQFPELFHASQGYGWNIQQSQSFNWQTLRDNKTQEIRRLNGIYQNLLSNSGAQIIKGRASLESPNQVSVNGHTYSAENILIATGGWPYIPEFEGSDLAISSNEMFTLEQLPEKAVVVGGGYIAVEFAGILNGLGVKTDLIYRGDRLLKSFDPQCSEKVTEGMIAKGINIQLNTEVRSISGQESKLTVHLNNGQSLEAGIALYATGRTANTQGLGLENTKIKTQSNGAIVVDDYFKTAEPNIYALGDVIDRVQLTPVAIQESMLLLEQLYGESKPRMDYDNIPTAVFSQPELATVGLTEQQARDQYSNIKVYESDFRPMFETLGQGKGRVYIKLIVDSAIDRVVGCHMVGEHAAEIIQGIAIAIKAGATKANFDQTMGIHPTVAEEFVTLR
jgi:glutathione reductase (NADPH)